MKRPCSLRFAGITALLSVPALLFIVLGIDAVSAGITLKALREFDEAASIRSVRTAPEILILDEVVLPGRNLSIDRLIVYWSGNPFFPEIDSLLAVGGTWKLPERDTDAIRRGETREWPPARFDHIEIIHGDETTVVSGVFSGKAPGDSMVFLLDSEWGRGTGNILFGHEYDSLHVDWFQFRRIPGELFTLPEILHGFELEGNLSATLNNTLSASGVITEVNGDPAEILFSMNNAGGKPYVSLSTDISTLREFLITQAESMIGDIYIDFAPSGTVFLEFMDSDTIGVTVDARLDSVRIYSIVLSDDTVNTIAGLRFQSTMCMSSWEVNIDSGSAVFGSVPVSFDITGRFKQHPRFEIRLWSECISGEDLIESIPDELLGRLTGLRLGGDASFDILFILDWEVPDSSDFQASVDVSGLRVLASPVAIGHLRQGGSCLMRDSRGRTRNIYLDTLKNPDFVPFDLLHPSLEGLLKCAEDATFRSHNGFCLYHIRNSIRANVERGRFVRGGSTISMQLARNLFLERKKTYARKLQEVFLTWRLETYLSKNRILEIYANIVELGPDVFGFQDAARHYFSADLKELSTRQVAFLVSILPGPALYHRFYVNNNVPDYWEAYLDRLISISANRGWINADSAIRAMGDSIVFIPCPEAL
ncbi:MAG: transglycosylase domain-containing protein [Candidatus Aegiribacteria sp.]|nr:transglycosylase domain-containing protein [Candidatus Aegiribacteria sp.]